MSSKTGERSLVSLLLERLFNKTDAERDETFSSWFTYDEIDWFRDNADISKMDPLFRRYQDKMEVSLEECAEEIGLKTHEAIIGKLQEETGGRKGQWRLLERMIDIMTKREEFFEMMQALAEKRFASGDGVSQREMDELFDFGDSDSDDGSAGGKSAGGGAASKK